MRRVHAILSHWHVLRQDFRTPIEPFYDRIEAGIRARDIPGFSISRHTARQGGPASAKRRYLRVERELIAFDLCAAPFGGGFFFSWWLVAVSPQHRFATVILTLIGAGFFARYISKAIPSVDPLIILFVAFPAFLFVLGLLVYHGHIGSEESVLALPLLGWLYKHVFHPVTYYSMDSAIMFREMVHSVVLQAIDELSTEGGMRELDSDERKPAMTTLLEAGGRI